MTSNLYSLIRRYYEEHTAPPHEITHHCMAMCLTMKTPSYWYRDLHYKRSSDRLRFTMEIPISVRRHLLVNRDPGELIRRLWYWQCHNRKFAIMGGTGGCSDMKNTNFVNESCHYTTLVFQRTAMQSLVSHDLSFQLQIWQPSRPASLLLAGLTLWPIWLKRWLGTLEWVRSRGVRYQPRFETQRGYWCQDVTQIMNDPAVTVNTMYSWASV